MAEKSIGEGGSTVCGLGDKWVGEKNQFPKMEASQRESFLNVSSLK